MAKYWIIPRVGDKELPRVGHQLASSSLLISYVLMFLYLEWTEERGNNGIYTSMGKFLFANFSCVPSNF